MPLNVAVCLPETIRAGYEDIILVLPNEQGSALTDYHGAMASHLAQEVGMRVLAFERPLSADRAVFNLGVRRHISTAYPALASHTASRLYKLIEKEGAGSVVTAGHSAAGLFALQMTVSESLPVTASFVTDPPAIRHGTPLKAELIDYLGFQLFSEARKPSDGLPLNPGLPHVPPGATLLKRHLNEVTEYSAVYRSTIGLEALRQIAVHMPKVGVRAAFPEHTFTAKPGVLRDIVARSAFWRTGQGAPFDIQILKGAYHSTFSNHHFFGNLLRQALDEMVPV